MGSGGTPRAVVEGVAGGNAGGCEVDEAAEGACSANAELITEGLQPGCGHHLLHSPHLRFGEGAELPPTLTRGGVAEGCLGVADDEAKLGLEVVDVGLGGDADGDVPAVEQEASHAGGVSDCFPQARAGVDVTAGPEEGEEVTGDCGAGGLRPEGTKVEAAAAAATKPLTGLWA